MQNITGLLPNLPLGLPTKKEITAFIKQSPNSEYGILSCGGQLSTLSLRSVQTLSHEKQKELKLFADLVLATTLQHMPESSIVDAASSGISLIPMSKMTIRFASSYLQITSDSGVSPSENIETHASSSADIDIHPQNKRKRKADKISRSFWTFPMRNALKTALQESTSLDCHQLAFRLKLFNINVLAEDVWQELSVHCVKLGVECTLINLKYNYQPELVDSLNEPVAKRHRFIPKFRRQRQRHY